MAVRLSSNGSVGGRHHHGFLNGIVEAISLRLLTAIITRGRTNKPILVGGPMFKWFTHAFAIDPPGPAQPNETQRLVVERLVREIVRRHLTTPALLMLELSRPLNFVSAQLLHFFQPFLASIADAHAYNEFSLFLEQRGSVDYISERLEVLEHECESQERTQEHCGER